MRTPPPPDGAMDSTGYLLSPVAIGRQRRSPAACRLGVGSSGRLRPGRPTRVGSRRRRAHHPLVARLGKHLQQRATGHPHRVQPVREVDGMERQGVAPADDPLPGDRRSATSASTPFRCTSPTTRRTRRPTNSEPVCPAAASASTTSTPRSSGRSPTSAPPSSSPDRALPPLFALQFHWGGPTEVQRKPGKRFELIRGGRGGGRPARRPWPGSRRRRHEPRRLSQERRLAGDVDVDRPHTRSCRRRATDSSASTTT